MDYLCIISHMPCHECINCNLILIMHLSAILIISNIYQLSVCNAQARSIQRHSNYSKYVAEYERDFTIVLRFFFLGRNRSLFVMCTLDKFTSPKLSCLAREKQRIIQKNNLKDFPSTKYF